MQSERRYRKRFGLLPQSAVVSWLEPILARLLGPRVPRIAPEEAFRRAGGDEAQALIVDVRQPVEYASGTIPGATLIPLTELGQRMAELPQERQIMTICRSGHRSPIAARRLKKAGYNVLDVTGGIDAWRGASLPVEA